MPARVPNLIYLIYASYLSDLSLSMLVLKKIVEAMVSYIVLMVFPANGGEYSKTIGNGIVDSLAGIWGELSISPFCVC